MNEPDIFDALRRQGIDADDPEIRAAIRLVLEYIQDVRERSGPHAARRCMEAMHQALAYQLQHPDVGEDEMSRFEAEFDDEDGT